MQVSGVFQSARFAVSLHFASLHSKHFNVPTRADPVVVAPAGTVVVGPGGPFVVTSVVVVTPAILVAVLSSPAAIWNNESVMKIAINGLVVSLPVAIFLWKINTASCT